MLKKSESVMKLHHSIDVCNCLEYRMACFVALSNSQNDCDAQTFNVDLHCHLDLYLQMVLLHFVAIQNNLFLNRSFEFNVATIFYLFLNKGVSLL